MTVTAVRHRPPPTLDEVERRAPVTSLPGALRGRPVRWGLAAGGAIGVTTAWVRP